MRFLTQICDHFHSFEAHGFLVCEFDTVSIDHGSNTIRQFEEITRHFA